MPPVKSRKAVSRKEEKPVVAEAPVVEAQAEEKPKRFTKSEIKDEERRQKALEKFLKDKLGLDLNNARVFDTQTLYDLAQGKVTKPLEMVVTPLVYNSATKELEAMPKLKVMDSLRIDFPSANGKQIAHGDKTPYVETIACRRLLEKAEGVIPERSKPVEVEEKPVSFSEAQIRALEGVGIKRNRLYGGFNYLSRETKADIAEGRVFPVDGQVRTDFGFVKVIGDARLEGDSVRFQTSYPEAREENTILDLRSARIQEYATGSIEFDFYMRDSSRRVITDVNGQPIFNRAAENLAKYGMAMEPVLGRKHMAEWDKKERVMKDSVSAWEPYQLTVVNGNIYATKMKEVIELGEDGKPIMEMDKSGKEVEKTHAEVYVRTKDGTVFLDNQGGKALEFATPGDYDRYIRGKVAVVKDAVYHDYKTNKDTVYNAAVVADNRAAGYGKAFTPATSQEIIARMDKKQTARRKQDFNFGL